MNNLPKTAEWTNYTQTLELTGQTNDSRTLIVHLLTFERSFNGIVECHRRMHYLSHVDKRMERTVVDRRMDHILRRVLSPIYHEMIAQRSATDVA